MSIYGIRIQKRIQKRVLLGGEVVLAGVGEGLSDVSGHGDAFLGACF